MISARDVAWAAGLIEGEGSFMISKGSPCIQVQMTDGDAVERLLVLQKASDAGLFAIQIGLVVGTCSVSLATCANGASSLAKTERTTVTRRQHENSSLSRRHGGVG